MTSDLLAAALDSLPDGIAVLDADGAVVHESAAWRGGRRILDRADVAAGIAAVLSGRVPEFSVEHDAQHACWALRVLPLAGGSGALVVRSDVTERRRVEERARALQEALRQEASTDALTGVLNRRHLDRRVAEAVRLARRHKRPLALLMVDLDDFKAVNDVHGHAVGDDVLREVGRRLRLAARRTDVVGRYGGEEFVVLLPETEPEGAAATGERVRLAVAEPPLDLEGLGITLGASVGVACLGCGGVRDRLGLYVAADRALYAAKRSGRGRVVVDSMVADDAAG
jgi:diguanylate cyclase (GGDEF)-like protein